MSTPDPSRSTSIRASHVLLDLEQFLPYRISVLSNRVSSNIAKLYGDRYGLSIPEWRVITILALYPGSSASEVSDRTAMDKVAVSRAVARLLERGFIRRETHGDDRRRSVLALSAAGFEVYETVAPLVMEITRKLMSVLTEEEEQTLERLITRLADAGLPQMTMPD
ncbi:MarR family transcriptional regulator [Flavobacterium sp. MXW15]|uniref:MarR family transcriptional regulator n=1 Tax=Xanthomonas chitinilytica TaxID=2989819 RepID=A0ABT3JWK5_9XANT|nr:MarR family transcriptional regulator [Xanthomonas sp. H13-6]MCW4455632.1 MarR family transcriptional regulator [Flavobacterium sp. MXW15]MCW4472882.1 MarR family transcriptional regulator [Xanthomonas sp. H13-6]